MSFYYLTFRSVTAAQRAMTLLEKKGLRVRLVRTPHELSDGGCGYSLRLSPAALRAAQPLLSSAGIAPGRAFAVYPNGEYVEVFL